MNEVNRIGLLKPDAKIQTPKNGKEPIVSGKAFENQLFETVEKLKTLDNEVEAMLESTQLQKADATNASLRLSGKKEDVIAENFSAAQKTFSKSAKYVAAQYEQAKK
ncbi:MAG: hypothetical protein HQ517_15960 [SAR324 cluster bacterium]|nr:hypothetical protein [SAR324 cluster bacterium]